MYGHRKTQKVTEKIHFWHYRKRHAVWHRPPGA